jgi:glucokinase
VNAFFVQCSLKFAQLQSIAIVQCTRSRQKATGWCCARSAAPHYSSPHLLGFNSQQDSTPRAVTNTKQIIVADIGGTFARLALVDTSMSPPKIHQLVRYETATTTFEDAVFDFVDKQVIDATSELHLRIAVAAPVLPVQRSGDSPVQLTNNPWIIEKTRISSRKPSVRMNVVNDFAAVAMGTPHLSAGEFTVFARGDTSLATSPDLPKLAIGPGTGLGIATVVGNAGQWIVLPGEGGHVTLGANDARQTAILDYAKTKFAHISAERLLSGTGIPLLYEAICHVDNLVSNAKTSREIADAARANDRAALATLQTFASMLGNVAGNAALTVGALGGVYLAGGLIQRWQSLFPLDAFMDSFLAKGRFRDYLQRVPVYRIDADEPGLIGLARGFSTELETSA